MTTQYTDVLLGQWRAVPRFRAVVGLVQAIRDEGLAALDRLQLMLDVDEAEGVWLDYLGVRLGIRRPSTTDPTQDPRFGFDAAGVGFGQKPFRGSLASDLIFPLPDAVYRGFVKARAVTVLGNGTLQTFTRAVRHIDRNATVVDGRDMTVAVTSAVHELLELADSIGALPRTAGVRVTYGAP